MQDFTIHRYRDEDAEELTALLHAGYAELGRMGLNFTAIDQSVATTRYRAGLGHCLLARCAGDLVATLTITFPPSEVLQAMTRHARVPNRAWLNQMAVHPERRGQGLASRLWAAGRQWAVDHGATSIGLDTAAPASHLRRLYARWGFVATPDTIHWEGKSYVSIVMLRNLPE